MSDVGGKDGDSPSEAHNPGPSKNPSQSPTTTNENGDPNTAATKKKSENKKVERDLLDVANFVVLLGAFGAALYAGIQAQRLAGDTEGMSTAANSAADLTHRDNVNALDAVIAGTNTARAESNDAVIAGAAEADNALTGSEVENQKTLVETEKSTIDAERAWIHIANPLAMLTFTNNVITGIEPQATVIDIGKQPATFVRSAIRPFWLTPTLGDGGNGKVSIDMRAQKYIPNDTCEEASKDSGIGTVWPDYPVGTTGDGPQPVDERLTTRREYFGFQGCVIYTTFGKIHFSKVCWVLVPDSQEMKDWKWSFCQGAGQQDAN